MRMIVMLIALLIVGLLIYQNMTPVPNQPQNQPMTSEVNPPQIPTNPNNVNQFSNQMNDFVNKQADKQKAAIDKQSQ